MSGPLLMVNACGPLWELSAAPDAVGMGSVLGLLILAGAHVTAAGNARYLAEGGDSLPAIAEWVPGQYPGVSLAVVQPPTGRIALASSATPPRAAVRTTTLHSGDPRVYDLVRAALDHKLTVRPATGNRFAVTGPTSVQVAWLAAVLGKTAVDARSLLGVTDKDVAREDRLSLAPAVTVELPNRRTVTEVKARDSDGGIARVEHLETTE